MKYKFRAIDIKTGKPVEGDLAYVNQDFSKQFKQVKPMIVSLHAHGGNIWCGARHYIDETTLQLIKY